MMTTMNSNKQNASEPMIMFIKKLIVHTFYDSGREDADALISDIRKGMMEAAKHMDQEATAMFYPIVGYIKSHSKGLLSAFTAEEIAAGIGTSPEVVLTEIERNRSSFTKVYIGDKLHYMYKAYIY